MRAKERLELELRAAAERELASQRRLRLPAPRLPGPLVPAAGLLALVLFAVLVAAPALRDGGDAEREAAAPRTVVTDVPDELLGAFQAEGVTVIFDFDRYTIELPDATIRGDAGGIPAGLRLTHDGAGDCKTAPARAAVYTYRFRGDALTFSALDDPCPSRRRALTRVPFRRQG